jgi:hypothetical protein
MHIYENDKKNKNIWKQQNPSDPSKWRPTVTRSTMNPTETTLEPNPDFNVRSMWLTAWTNTACFMLERRTMLKQPEFVNWKY